MTNVIPYALYTMLNIIFVSLIALIGIAFVVDYLIIPIRRRRFINTLLTNDPVKIKHLFEKYRIYFDIQDNYNQNRFYYKDQDDGRTYILPTHIDKLIRALNLRIAYNEDFSITDLSEANDVFRYANRSMNFQTVYFIKNNDKRLVVSVSIIKLLILSLYKQEMYIRFEERSAWNLSNADGRLAYFKDVTDTFFSKEHFSTVISIMTDYYDE